MSCGETTDAFERTYLNLLSQSRFYNVNVRGDTLTVRGATGTVLLVFDAAPANPLKTVPRSALNVTEGLPVFR
jgi:hypothetical protein